MAALQLVTSAGLSSGRDAARQPLQQKCRGAAGAARRQRSSLAVRSQAAGAMAVPTPQPGDSRGFFKDLLWSKYDKGVCRALCCRALLVSCDACLPIPICLRFATPLC